MQREGGERGEREERKERGGGLIEIFVFKNKDILGIKNLFHQNYVILRYIHHLSSCGVLPYSLDPIYITSILNSSHEVVRC